MCSSSCAFCFVPALVEGRLPQPHRGDRFRIPARLAGEAGGREDQVAEERRLLYVAATRAKRHLCFTYPINVYRYSDVDSPPLVSRFLDAIPEEILNRATLAGME